MKYYVTIYIDPLVECFLDFKNQCYWQREDFTHAFLGLTKDKSPDELDTMKFERDVKYWDCNLGKLVTFRKEEYMWYDTTTTNEFNDGFWGFGTKMNSVNVISNKMLKNNQYIAREYL
ncbi:hypothetical protein [Campylobacter jejuni]|uniref:hypothetical protein n=4 Tax=Campylobacter jejuni TaxID=197 RepID=UPI0016434AF6|nr:hypothetical protein [Campylobacter jejuni]